MTTRSLLLAGTALATTTAAAVAAAVPATGAPATTPAATAAPSAATVKARPIIDDIDADLRFDGRVRLEAETAGAARVTFTYRGRRVAAHKGRLDREDGTRDWRRTVAARGGDASGLATVTIKVRACKGDVCVTRSDTERLEREDLD
jgi:hypothetical protein